MEFPLYAATCSTLERLCEERLNQIESLFSLFRKLMETKQAMLKREIFQNLKESKYPIFWTQAMESDFIAKMKKLLSYIKINSFVTSVSPRTQNVYIKPTFTMETDKVVPFLQFQSPPVMRLFLHRSDTGYDAKVSRAPPPSFPITHVRMEQGTIAFLPSGNCDSSDSKNASETRVDEDGTVSRKVKAKKEGVRLLLTRSWDQAFVVPIKLFLQLNASSLFVRKESRILMDHQARQDEDAFSEKFSVFDFCLPTELSQVAHAIFKTTTSWESLPEDMEKEKQGREQGRGQKQQKQQKQQREHFLIFYDCSEEGHFMAQICPESKQLSTYTLDIKSSGINSSLCWSFKGSMSTPKEWDFKEQPSDHRLFGDHCTSIKDCIYFVPLHTRTEFSNPLDKHVRPKLQGSDKWRHESLFHVRNRNAELVETIWLVSTNTSDRSHYVVTQIIAPKLYEEKKRLQDFLLSCSTSFSGLPIVVQSKNPIPIATHSNMKKKSSSEEAGVWVSPRLEISAFESNVFVSEKNPCTHEIQQVHWLKVELGIRSCFVEKVGAWCCSSSGSPLPFAKKEQASPVTGKSKTKDTRDVKKSLIWIQIVPWNDLVCVLRQNAESGECFIAVQSIATLFRIHDGSSRAHEAFWDLRIPFDVTNRSESWRLRPFLEKNAMIVWSQKSQETFLIDYRFVFYLYFLFTTRKFNLNKQRAAAT